MTSSPLWSPEESRHEASARAGVAVAHNYTTASIETKDRVILPALTRTAFPWALPVVGEVRAPGAVLIRPDGHVAWAGDPDDAALRDVIAGWFAASSMG